jgi:hypothetical protein
VDSKRHLPQFVLVLACVVCAEEQLTTRGQGHVKIRLRAAAVAAVGCSQVLVVRHSCVHCHLLCNPKKRAMRLLNTIFRGFVPSGYAPDLSVPVRTSQARQAQQVTIGSCLGGLAATACGVEPVAGSGSCLVTALELGGGQSVDPGSVGAYG